MEESKTIAMHQFQLRLYDARASRWPSIAPYRQYYSPYVGMGNNPMLRVDADGGLDDRIDYNSKTGETIITTLPGQDELYIDGEYMGIMGPDGSWRYMGFDVSIIGPDPGYLYYVLENNGGPGHALIFDPATGYYMEINNPRDKNIPGGFESGFKNWVGSGTLSGAYKAEGYKFTSFDALLNSQGGRNSDDFEFYKVAVPNKRAAIGYYNFYVNKEWDYNLLYNNCKHFAVHGLLLGGADVSVFETNLPIDVIGNSKE